MTPVLLNVRYADNGFLAGQVVITPTKPMSLPDTYVTTTPVVAYFNGSLERTVYLHPSSVIKTTYIFQIYEAVTYPQVGNVGQEGYVPEYTANVLRDTFEATVPNTDQVIKLSDLATQTGYPRDRIEQTFSLLLARLSTDVAMQTFASRILTFRGGYVPNVLYRKGDIVYFQGSAYVNLNSIYTASTTNPDVNPQWTKFVDRGLPGTGTTGNNATYDAVTWLGSTQVPTQNSVRNIIETLALKTEVNSKVSATSPSLLGTPTAPTAVYGTNTTQIATTEYVRQAAVPIGCSMDYRGSSPPPYWMFEDGRILLRASYPALFSVLGTTYNLGGELGTQFRIPDSRGRVSVCADQLSVLMGAASRLTEDVNTLGGAGGSQSVVLTVAQIPAHTHNYITIFPSSTTASGGSLGAVGNSTANASSVSTSTGGGGSHSNLPPYLVSARIIHTGVL